MPSNKSTHRKDKKTTATIMTINEGRYCHVDTSGVDTVDQGPRLLPQNWETADGTGYNNINNTDNWPDARLITIEWFPYVLIDAGVPNPLPQKYNRSLSDFVINPADVTQTAIYTEFTTQQYDQTAPVSPIDWEEIPAAQRQFVDVPYQSVDRLVVARHFQTWNTPDDIFGLRATLYTDLDASAMTVKIHNEDGTYLYAMELNEVEPGVWFSETPSGAWGQHLERKAWRYFVFKGVDITPEMRLPFEAERSTHDIKWNPGINGILR